MFSQSGIKNLSLKSSAPATQCRINGNIKYKNRDNLKTGNYLEEKSWIVGRGEIRVKLIHLHDAG